MKPDDGKSTPIVLPSCHRNVSASSLALMRFSRSIRGESGRPRMTPFPLRRSPVPA